MTDSAADISPRLIKEYNLAIVPTVIRFGEEVFYEDVDITLEEYYKKFHSSEHYPQTANPTLHHQYELYEKLRKEADEVLNIVISSGISGSSTGSCSSGSSSGISGSSIGSSIGVGSSTGGSGSGVGSGISNSVGCS